MKNVPVDLNMLAVALESHDENKWYLDLQTGDVLPVFDDPEMEDQIESDPDRFRLIECDQSPGDDFRAMEDFVSGLKEGEARRDLERVLQRAKPFRNFREALRDWPEVRDQWFAVHDRRISEAARAWLADHDIEAIPRTKGA